MSRCQAGSLFLLEAEDKPQPPGLPGAPHLPLGSVRLRNSVRPLMGAPHAGEQAGQGRTLTGAVGSQVFNTEFKYRIS